MSKAAGDRAPSTRQLRDAVAEHVGATSLRHVAREVGVSASGLQYFVRGGTPYGATRRKLEGWYVRATAGGYAEVPPEAVLNTLRSLVQALPPAEREAALAEVVASLHAAFARRNVAPPAWLARARELASGTEPGGRPRGRPPG